MTENKIGRNLYWFWALYASFIPFLITTLFIVSLMKWLEFNIGFFVKIMSIPLWFVSFILSGVIIRVPYLRIYDKYKWEYDNVCLVNEKKNIKIQNNEIEKIYIGFICNSKPLIKKVNEIFNSELNGILDILETQNLILVLSDKRIMFLQFTGLMNGAELQKQFLEENIEKVTKDMFNISEYKKSGNRLKWYKIIKIKEK